MNSSSHLHLTRSETADSDAPEEADINCVELKTVNSNSTVTISSNTWTCSLKTFGCFLRHHLSPVRLKF